MRRVALALVGVAALLGGCRALPTGFTCTDDDQCERAAVPGRCEDTGHCSFPDTSCGVGGWRYGDLAGGGLGGTCASGYFPDAGLPDAPDDGPPDGPHDAGPPPDGADGPLPDDGPPPVDAPQADAGPCCETCYDTCYAKCYDTCVDVCYDLCCIYYWDVGYGECLSQTPAVCTPADLAHGCDTGYECGSGHDCNPHQCNPHDCNPTSCSLASCNCSPLGCESYECNPRPCNCRDC